MASLRQQMGIIGVGLPTISSYSNGGTAKPPRLQDNIDSGYAVWMSWVTLVADAASLGASIEKALASPRRLIANMRE